jgi:hypothetical protein
MVLVAPLSPTPLASQALVPPRMLKDKPKACYIGGYGLSGATIKHKTYKHTIWNH